MDVYKRTFFMEKEQHSVVRNAYVVPTTEVIIVRMNSILCGSNEGVDEFEGVW